jgi:hydroxypyruvate reductase
MTLPVDLRTPLLQSYAAALAAVDGRTAVRRWLEREPPPPVPVFLLAVGKAAGAMAQGAVDVLGGRIGGGLVVSKPGHLDVAQCKAGGLEALEGGHPVPSAGSLAAGRRLLQLLDGCRGGVVLCLFSGGASSLLEVPAAGLGLRDLQRAGDWLLGSGLAIAGVNSVRKALSRIKGGGLLPWLSGCRVMALAISDVPGNDAAVIGSGLLVPDPGLAARLAALDLPPWLRGWVNAGLAERSGIPSQGPAVRIVADLDQAKAAAAERADALGHRTFVHGEFVAGSAASAGAKLARELMSAAPGVHVWGGETTVVLPPRPGRGGRSQHLALAAAMALAGRGDCALLSAGTDGSDGPTEDAGALVDGGTVARAARAGLDPAAALRQADSGRLLAAAGDLIRTGPTGTNVMDLMLGLRAGASGP